MYDRQPSQQPPPLSRSRSLPREKQNPQYRNQSPSQGNVSAPKNPDYRSAERDINKGYPANDSFVFSGANQYSQPNKSVSPPNRNYGQRQGNDMYSGDRRNDNVFSIPANVHEDKTYFNNRGMNY